MDTVRIMCGYCVDTVWISKNTVNTALSLYSLVTGQQELGKMAQHSSYCPGVNICTLHRQCNWWCSESFTEYSVT